MTIGTDIIERALMQIGAHSVAMPANQESIDLGKDILTSMLEQWLTKNIKIGFTPLLDPGDDLNEPPDTTNAIISNLSLLLVPNFNNGKPVSPEIRKQAHLDFVCVKGAYQINVIPDKVVSSTLPRGMGNRRWNRRRIYFQKDAVLNG